MARITKIPGGEQISIKLEPCDDNRDNQSFIRGIERLGARYDGDNEDWTLAEHHLNAVSRLKQRFLPDGDANQGNLF